MVNSQLGIFEDNFDALLKLTQDFIDSVIDGDYENRLNIGITDELIDIFIEAFLNQADYILNELGMEIGEVDRRHITNSASRSGFARVLIPRLGLILQKRREEIISRILAGEDKEEIRRSMYNVAELIVTSELQMAVEGASVSSGKLIQELFGQGITIYKTWHSVNDERTCPVCSALDGTTVPVEESFLGGVDDSGDVSLQEIEDYLSYSGGDIPYAHPRCRCWVTYSR